GLPILIFPATPLVELRRTIQRAFQNPAASNATKGRPPRIWRRPLVAAGVALVVMIALIVILLNSSLFRRQSRQANADEVVREEMAGARRDIADGEFHRAAEHFREARRIVERQEGDGNGRQSRWLAQVEREANMMSDLLIVSPAEILQQAKGLGEDSWQRI